MIDKYDSKRSTKSTITDCQEMPPIMINFVNINFIFVKSSIVANTQEFVFVRLTNFEMCHTLSYERILTSSTS